MFSENVASAVKEIKESSDIIIEEEKYIRKRKKQDQKDK